MTGQFLIDVTEARFFIPYNEDVIGFIRRSNPFAHSDVGDVLFGIGKQMGAAGYCPAVKSCAYVVLHTPTNRIFAIAYGQRGLALRFAGAAHAEALADGGMGTPAIGSNWIRFDPWGAPPGGPNPHLRRWAERSYAEALAAAE